MSALEKVPEPRCLPFPVFDGGWSLVEHFDRGGSRYCVFARRDEPERASRGLSERQREVVTRAALGVPNKLVACELGLSQAGTSRSLAGAMLLLGVRRRTELVRVFSAVVDPNASYSWTEPQSRLGLLSFEIRRAPSVRLVASTGAPGESVLTAGQRRVARLAVLGRTNAQIATELGLSLHTVANHMGAILAKTGAGSRFELARRFDD
jgi:DNA-binding CsgD family transcriptional regulator